MSDLTIATLIFVVTYAVIISERLERAVVALAGAALMIAFGVLNQHQALESIDPNTGQITIHRGTTPFTQDCEADGIATGPMHDELYPSKWCKKKNCTPKAK